MVHQLYARRSLSIIERLVAWINRRSSMTKGPRIVKEAKGKVEPFALR
jgi:hypothetical protein